MTESLKKVQRHICYDKLWHILIDRHMTREELRKGCGLSSNTIAKLGKGENLTTEVLLRICNYLDCDIEDILETVREES